MCPPPLDPKKSGDGTIGGYNRGKETKLFGGFAAINKNHLAKYNGGGDYKRGMVTSICMYF